MHGIFLRSKKKSCSKAVVIDRIYEFMYMHNQLYDKILVICRALRKTKFLVNIVENKIWIDYVS